MGLDSVPVEGVIGVEDSPESLSEDDLIFCLFDLSSIAIFFLGGSRHESVEISDFISISEALVVVGLM